MTVLLTALRALLTAQIKQSAYLSVGEIHDLEYALDLVQRDLRKREEDDRF